jgi:hypothetical protein
MRTALSTGSVRIVRSRLAQAVGYIRGPLLVSAVGLGIGVATSFLQADLDSPWSSLANAVTTWLIAPFLVGSKNPDKSRASSAGALVAVCEVAGYYTTSILRGYPEDLRIVLFWLVWGVLGGALLALAGRMWSTGRPRGRDLGPAVLGGSFISEGIVSYAIRLDDPSSALLFCALGVASVVVFAVRGRGVLAAAMWLVLTVPLGMAGQATLAVVSSLVA